MPRPMPAVPLPRKALLHHGNVFLDVGVEGAAPALRARLANAMARAHHTMAARLPAILEAVSQNTVTHLLTAAFTSVIQGQLVPSGVSLQWMQLCRQVVCLPTGSDKQTGQHMYTPQNTDAGTCFMASFEAVCPTSGTLFSFNVVTGVVLINGRPPGCLPYEITQHPLFLGTFGSHTNFEVGARCPSAVSVPTTVWHRWTALVCGRWLSWACDSQTCEPYGPVLLNSNQRAESELFTVLICC